MSSSSPPGSSNGPEVQSYTEWDPLEEVLVGFVEGASQLPWELSLEAVTPRDDVEALAVVAEQVDRAALERFPKLRVVANYGAGYDLVDVDACRERGVVVTNTPGVTAAATAAGCSSGT